MDPKKVSSFLLHFQITFISRTAPSDNCSQYDYQLVYGWKFEHAPKLSHAFHTTNVMLIQLPWHQWVFTNAFSLQEHSQIPVQPAFHCWNFLFSPPKLLDASTCSVWLLVNPDNQNNVFYSLFRNYFWDDERLFLCVWGGWKKRS